MRAHGGGQACYIVPLTPTCDQCRGQHANVARASNRRYKTTAKGMLAVIRSRAKVRKG